MDIAGDNMDYRHGTMTIEQESYAITVKNSTRRSAIHGGWVKISVHHTFSLGQNSQHTLRIDTLQYESDNSKFSFFEWNDCSTSPEKAILADAEKTICADFTIYFQLSLTSNPEYGGEILIEPAKTWYEENAPITLAARPQSDYDFKN